MKPDGGGSRAVSGLLMVAGAATWGLAVAAAEGVRVAEALAVGAGGSPDDPSPGELVTGVLDLRMAPLVVILCEMTLWSLRPSGKPTAPGRSVAWP